jgi:hypothetical protein
VQEHVVAPRQEGNFPKRIWFLWLQGLDKAPVPVRECHAQWQVGGSGWDLVTLNADNLSDWIGAEHLRWMEKVPPTQRSDAIRLYLLAAHGGVWADATIWCARPLDQWLPGLLNSGCFAFSMETRSRLISSWFLASLPGNPLIVAMRDAMTEHWRDHVYHHGLPARIMRKAIETTLAVSPKLTRAWFTPIMQDWLRLSPYFAFHYKFTEVIKADKVAADVWSHTPLISADGPHLLQHYGLLKHLSPEAKATIDKPASPIFKLLWKNFPREIPAGSTLDYLFNSGAIARTQPGSRGLSTS